MVTEADFLMGFLGTVGESENADVGVDCKDYIERRVGHLEAAGDNLAMSGMKKPRKLDQREMPARGYNTASDVVMAGELPKLSQTFKKSANLLQEDHGAGKRKGGELEEGEEAPVKVKKVKKL